MRAILIDAEHRTFTEVNYTGDISQLQGWVGGHFDIVRRLKEYGPLVDDIYVDDEGLYKGYAYGFTIVPPEGGPRYQQYLCGNGVILGADERNGESRGAQITLEEVHQRIRFVEFSDPQDPEAAIHVL